MENHLKEFLLIAESKAIATFGNNSINVVPISTINIVGEEIVLVDYFMEKTVANILQNENVSLVAWKGLFGYQIKCKARHEKQGELFSDMVEFVKQTLPDRVVKGILILKIEEVFDIAPTKNTKQEFGL
ncbi:MAG: hypothetical protein KBD12_02205 [Candidatus Pacebacteria bacterium]|nr:hypothetical protein [Candidatus Paceibacterota bacterium]